MMRRNFFPICHRSLPLFLHNAAPVRPRCQFALPSKKSKDRNGSAARWSAQSFFLFFDARKKTRERGSQRLYLFFSRSLALVQRKKHEQDRKEPPPPRLLSLDTQRSARALKQQQEMSLLPSGPRTWCVGVPEASSAGEWGNPPFQKRGRKRKNDARFFFLLARADLKSSKSFLTRAVPLFWPASPRSSASIPWSEKRHSLSY